MLTAADAHIRASIDCVFETSCVFETDDVIGTSCVNGTSCVISYDSERFYIDRGHWLATFLAYALQRREEALINFI
jgi:hypothetical protein